MLAERISGPAFVLGDNIDTDQIIPAKHLVYSLTDPQERRNFGRYVFSGVPDAKSGLPKGGIRFNREGSHLSDYRVVIAGKNFGCGSSREHAPVALKIAGVEAVVAASYARIFYRNAVDGGFFLPLEAAEPITQVATGDQVEIDLPNKILRHPASGRSFRLKPLGDVEEILRAGNVFEYARKAGLIR